MEQNNNNNENQGDEMNWDEVKFQRGGNGKRTEMDGPGELWARIRGRREAFREERLRVRET